MASFTNNSLKTTISIITLLSLLNFRHAAAVKGGYWFPGTSITSSNIDSTLFTHLFCAFADLNTQTNQITLPSECASFPKTVKQKNPSVKTLLSIGGGSAKSSDFNTMASQPSSRKTFIDSTITQALANGYDGLDLDWEQQSEIDEMNNLGTLLNEWRSAIKARSPSLLLTAALHYSPDANSVAKFPAQSITLNLDFVNVMAYDFYAPSWSPQPIVTRPHANLRDPTNSQVSGSNGISKWISAGVPANKLVLGFPYYGYAWKLSNANNNGILAPSTGGDTSIGGGTPSYQQIRSFISQKGAIVKYDANYVTNYCYFGTTWIAYDDLQTISAKVMYAKNSGLLGYFTWNVVQDNNWALSKQGMSPLSTIYLLLGPSLNF